MTTAKPTCTESGSGTAPASLIVRMTNLAPQRWANGRGWTREIHREPAADSPEAALWRLSLADIEEPGPFSLFPGMDRHLLSAAPVPLQLSVDGAPHDLGYTQIISFAGDSEVATTAVHGRAQALNLMTRRGVRSSLDVLRGDEQVSLSAASATALVVLDGTVSADGHRLQRFDTLLPGRDETLLGLQAATVVRVRVELPAALDKSAHRPNHPQHPRSSRP